MMQPRMDTWRYAPDTWGRGPGSELPLCQRAVESSQKTFGADASTTLLQRVKVGTAGRARPWVTGYRGKLLAQKDPCLLLQASLVMCS